MGAGWGSSCGFPPLQETAKCQSQLAVPVTPRAASAASVTLLANASARLVYSPALDEALTCSRSGDQAFSPFPRDCSCALATCPRRAALCPRPQDWWEVRQQLMGSGAWVWGKRGSQNCWKWPGRLSSQVAGGARDPSLFPAPTFSPILAGPGGRPHLQPLPAPLLLPERQQSRRLPALLLHGHQPAVRQLLLHPPPGKSLCPPLHWGLPPAPP